MLDLKKTPKRRIEGAKMTRGADRAGLAEVISRAKRATAAGGHERSDGTFVSRGPGIAGINATIALREMLPEVVGADGRVTRAPVARPSGETMTVRAAAMANSRVVQAGAHLIEMAEAEVAGFGAEPVLAEHPQEFSTIEAAPIDAVALTGAGADAEGDVTASALPIASATLDRSALTQRAWRVEIPRSALRDRGEDRVAGELMTAVAVGLGRAVDAELMTALDAAATVGFDLHAAAAKGLRMADLRAVIGTGAVSGPAVDRGELFVDGIPAELSGDVDATIIGAFERAAVFVQPELELLAERTAAGGLVMTLWADFQAAVPDAGFFWKREPA